MGKELAGHQGAQEECRASASHVGGDFRNHPGLSLAKDVCMIALGPRGYIFLVAPSFTMLFSRLCAYRISCRELYKGFYICLDGDN